MISKYLFQLARIWITWLFIVLDGLGLILFVTAYFIPKFELPGWTFWVFVLITLIGFVGANLKLFSDQDKIIRVLQEHIRGFEQNTVNENSIVLTMHPRPVHNVAEMQYIVGSEPIKDVDVRIISIDEKGERNIKRVNEFFALSDNLAAGHHVNGEFLKLNDGVRFHLPQRDKVKDGKVTIEVKFIGAKTGKSVFIKKELELRHPRESNIY